METETSITNDDLFATEPKTSPPEEPEPRLRATLLAAVHQFAASLGQEAGDLPSIDDLMSKTDEQIGWLRSRVVDAVRLALFGIRRPDVPSIDVQLENFRTWQMNLSTYFQWPSAAMEALRGKLMELGEGVELHPCFAMSIAIRLQDGRVIYIDRQGRQTPHGV
jgi:hypothetical protein